MASAILPFANEISNVLTSSGIAIFSGLYQHNPHGLVQIASKNLIDLVALSGIVMSSISVSEEYGPTSGTINGVLVLFVAFVIPNLTFHSITEKYCGKCNAGKKLAFGLSLIVVLFLIERFVVHKIAHSFSEHGEEDSH